MGNTLVFLGISVNAREALIALGALSFALMLTALRLWQGRRVLPVLIALPFGAAAALYLGRLIQWYCLSESYTSLGAAMSDLRTGGFSLVGVFAAAIGCAWLLRLTGAEKDIRGLLDDLALSGSLGIAAGRLGERFGSADRGKILIENEALQRLPFSAVAIHPVSGEAEWRFATFCAQSMWAFFLFLLLASRMMRLSRRENELREREKGGGFRLHVGDFRLRSLGFGLLPLFHEGADPRGRLFLFRQEPVGLGLEGLAVVVQGDHLPDDLPGVEILDGKLRDHVFGILAKGFECKHCYT